MDPERRYFFPVVGYNYRLTNVACAMLCAQLERLDELRALRASLVDAYRERLEPIAGIGLQPRASWAQPADWMFCITVEADRFGRSRDELAVSLDVEGIETRPFFYPIHRLPPYSSAGDIDLPETDRLASSGLNLPTSSLMTIGDVDRVVTAIQRTVARR